MYKIETVKQTTYMNIFLKGMSINYVCYKPVNMFLLKFALGNIISYTFLACYSFNSIYLQFRHSFFPMSIHKKGGIVLKKHTIDTSKKCSKTLFAWYSTFNFVSVYTEKESPFFYPYMQKKLSVSISLNVQEIIN